MKKTALLGILIFAISTMGMAWAGHLPDQGKKHVAWSNIKETGDRPSYYDRKLIRDYFTEIAKLKETQILGQDVTFANTFTYIPFLNGYGYGYWLDTYYSIESTFKIQGLEKVADALFDWIDENDGLKEGFEEQDGFKDAYSFYVSKDRKSFAIMSKEAIQLPEMDLDYMGTCADFNRNAGFYFPFHTYFPRTAEQALRNRSLLDGKDINLYSPRQQLKSVLQKIAKNKLYVKLSLRCQDTISGATVGGNFSYVIIHKKPILHFLNLN